VRERIGPVAAFKTAVAVSRLPKTRSGKILRSTIKKIVDGQSYNMPATLEDPAALSEIQAAARGIVRRLLQTRS
jgi:propionyl-CoA synthetase